MFSILFLFRIVLVFSFIWLFLDSGVNPSSRQTSGVTKGYLKLAFWMNPHSFFAKDTTSFLNKKKMYLSKRRKKERKKADKGKKNKNERGDNKRDEWTENPPGLLFGASLLTPLPQLLFLLLFLLPFLILCSNSIEAARARTSPMHPSSKTNWLGWIGAASWNKQHMTSQG